MPANKPVVTYRPIGTIDNAFDEPTSQDTLIASDSRIVLDPAMSEGLRGLSTGDTAMIIFHFHLAEGYQLLQHPRGDESRPKRGVFALRSPFRPNAIGITQVEILDIRENVLTVRGLDAINGTPVLDMKPV